MASKGYSNFPSRRGQQEAAHVGGNRPAEVEDAFATEQVCGNRQAKLLGLAQQLGTLGKFGVTRGFQRELTA